MPTLQSTVRWALRASAASPPASTSVASALPVTLRTVCRAVVLANPDRDRAAVVAWGDFARSRPDGVATVPPGRAVRVAVDRPRIDWAAGRTTIDGGRLGATGRGDGVAVDQNCTASAATVTAVVSAPCLARRLPVTAVAVGAVRHDLRFSVTRLGDPVQLADGVLLSGRPTPVDLTRFGPGSYLLTVSDGRGTLDRAVFGVEDCVTAAVHCSAITWTNPSGNAAVTLAFRDGRSAPQAVRLGPGQSARALAISGSVRWSAAAERAGGSRLSDAGADTATTNDDACLGSGPAGSFSDADTAAQRNATGGGSGAAGSGAAPPVASPGRSDQRVTSAWPAAFLPALVAALVVGGVGLGLRRRRAPTRR